MHRDCCAHSLFFRREAEPQFLSSSKWHRVVCHARRGRLNLPNEGSGQVQIKWVNYFRH